MADLRELVVSIDFGDVDIKTLLGLDAAIDEIEDSLKEMGREIDSATKDMTEFGVVGGVAMEEVAAATDDAKDEIDDLGDKLSQAQRRALLLGTTLSVALIGGIAAGAPLVGAIAGLTAGLGAATFAVAGFGAVAVGAFSEMAKHQKEITKLQKQINQTSDPTKKIALQQQLADVYANVSDSEKDALDNLHSFQAFWRKFVGKFNDPVFKAFAGTLTATEGILNGLEPTISKVADVVNELIDEFNTDLSGGGFQDFFDWLSTYGANSIYNFAQIGGNLLDGFFNILKAFTPLGMDMQNGLINLTQRFQDWTASLEDSKAFQNFVDYIKTNGPTLLDLIGNVWDIFVDLIRDLAPLGTVVLKDLTAVTGVIVDNWPGIRDTVMGVSAAVGTFVLGMEAMKIIGIVNDLMVGFRTGTLLATAAQWGLNTAMLANPMTWVIGIIAALVGIGVVLYQNWDTVKDKAGDLWKWMKDLWPKIKDAITGPLQPVVDLVGMLIDGWQNFVGMLKNFHMPKIGLPKFLGGNGLIQTDGSHATGLSRVPYDDYVANLHKDEAVLTADQSNALRDAGILSSKGDKPDLNLGSEIGGSKIKSGGVVFSPTINIEVNGGDNAKDIAKEAKKAAREELDSFWNDMVLKMA